MTEWLPAHNRGLTWPKTSKITQMFHFLLWQVTRQQLLAADWWLLAAPAWLLTTF